MQRPRPGYARSHRRFSGPRHAAYPCPSQCSAAGAASSRRYKGLWQREARKASSTGCGRGPGRCCASSAGSSGASSSRSASLPRSSSPAISDWSRSSRRSTSTTPTRSMRAWTSTESTIARLHDRAYFAQQSTLVTEDLKTVACISSPEHRTLINDAEDIPPLFVSAILASEDKNFFTHQGIDKMAILRALGKRILGESHSGASTLTMQIAKHLRGGTGRTSTELEKIGDIVMALRIEREFPRQELLVKYVNMPYFGRGQYGIEAASRAYFGKPAKELALPEVAFIVSLINKPALPDRAFATDPALRTREQIRDANWAESARGTTRVLDLMLDEGVIDEVEHARAASVVESSLRKAVLPPGTGCGTHDHFLERVRILYKDRFPINKGGLTISITRDDALQDVLDAGGRADAAHLSRSSPQRCGQRPVARRSVRRRFLGRRSRRGGQRQFPAMEVRRDRDGLAPAGLDVQDLHLRGPGRAAHQGGARDPAAARHRRARGQGSRALHGARRADIRLSRPRTRHEEDRELPFALGAGVSRRDLLPHRAGRVAQHGGDARRSARRDQERDRAHLSARHAEGREASAAALSDDGHRRLRSESAVDGVGGGLRQRRISRDSRGSRTTSAATASRFSTPMPTASRGSATSKAKATPHRSA